jgi:hypothetical protein
VIGRRPVLMFAISSLLIAGCYESLPVNDPDGSPPPWDGGVTLPDPEDCTEATGVDLLFVVDNSNSMAEEQASLAAELPNLVAALVSPPDDDGDRRPDWQPIPDLQVGVITPDMGTGGHLVPTCMFSDFGEDGVLRTVGNPDLPGCMGTYPPFLDFVAAADDPLAFASDVTCVAQAGTGGCGFEQPLEAMLKALSPNMPTAYTSASYTAPRFFRDTPPHGSGANAGFVRDDTLLAVVIVTDEEDCSASDLDLFDMSSAEYPGDLNLRCFLHGDRALHPISRYIDGLVALRARRPDLLAFALIAGIPVDLAIDAPSDVHFASILADPRMEERVDPTASNRLIPSCNVVGRGVAFPPRRLVSVAQGIGAGRTTIQSICQASFRPAAAAIARLFGRRACRTFEE